MADLPRWVDSWRVDSPAMYSAYLTYCGTLDEASTELHDLKQLPYQVHFSWLDRQYDDHGLRRLGVKSECRTVGCARCMEGCGGYVFRWYDKRWYPLYARNARPDAWRGP